MENPIKMDTLPETNISAPENGMVGIRGRFLLGPGLFSGAFAVSFKECMRLNMVYA